MSSAAENRRSRLYECWLAVVAPSTDLSLDVLNWTDDGVEVNAATSLSRGALRHTCTPRTRLARVYGSLPAGTQGALTPQARQPSNRHT